MPADNIAMQLAEVKGENAPPARQEIPGKERDWGSSGGING